MSHFTLVFSTLIINMGQLKPVHRIYTEIKFNESITKNLVLRRELAFMTLYYVLEMFSSFSHLILEMTLEKDDGDVGGSK